MGRWRPAAPHAGDPAGHGDGDDPDRDPIDAATALRVGLVSRIVPADELLPTARQIAQRIASHAPLAVRAAKEVAQSALDETLEHALRFGGALRWIIGQTEDAREGPRAFTERRPPRYQGR